MSSLVHFHDGTHFSEVLCMIVHWAPVVIILYYKPLLATILRLILGMLSTLEKPSTTHTSIIYSTMNGCGKVVTVAGYITKFPKFLMQILQILCICSDLKTHLSNWVSNLWHKGNPF